MGAARAQSALLTIIIRCLTFNLACQAFEIGLCEVRNDKKVSFIPPPSRNVSNLVSRMDSGWQNRVAHGRY